MTFSITKQIIAKKYAGCTTTDQAPGPTSPQEQDRGRGGQVAHTDHRPLSLQDEKQKQKVSREE